jgi:hypothetical protein
MGVKYCEYNGTKYETCKIKGKFLIESETKKENFEDYVTDSGIEYKGHYRKYIDLDEVDDLYEEELYIKYKGSYFKLFSHDKISWYMIVDDEYMLTTNSTQEVEEFGFDRLEPFVYAKYISRSEMEAIKIIRTHEPPFEEKGTEEIILEGDDLTEYLEEIYKEDNEIRPLLPFEEVNPFIYKRSEIEPYEKACIEITDTEKNIIKEDVEKTDTKKAYAEKVDAKKINTSKPDTREADDESDEDVDEYLREFDKKISEKRRFRIYLMVFIVWIILYSFAKEYKNYAYKQNLQSITEYINENQEINDWSNPQNR